MTDALLPSTRINLERATVLVLDDNGPSLDILSQVVSGFGVKQLHRAESVADAQSLIKTKTFDLIISDVQMPVTDGIEFIEWLRREGGDANRFIPVILVTGHTRTSQIVKIRDAGANYVVAKPITPKVLLERIFWVAREDRAFIECPTFVGPDRRFKHMGPPPGTDGRRKDDLPAEVGEAQTPNLSDDEISNMMRPAKVQI
ncbi:response regulator [Caulobacter vibrioides]|uniref:Chemotaxis protein CheYIII n=3 Tax=Caulobacter vibrioides TaxID=155892 RepID=H7C7G8_CAUVC|nr:MULTISPECIES: response regulator [Caulobacter]YP_002515824.1 single domain receiver protein CleA [Caulobacter vibrioides NA1000]AAK22427.1 chemotaxis protein CheYIII [Caulobacter vibrioides CB15]ACL93916.1 single domain receiver protein CleA [Caulobacter vibrioides NA1000]ATC23440.1 response regulator [Caulobacter vibrioides]ATC27270.1 response regulator [Caulobacter vibrioides]AZH11651.1 response regulator [Caulobacter vibrioides]